MARIPDGCYVRWNGDRAIVYNNKKYTLSAFLKILRSSGFNSNEIRDWINSEKRNVGIMDPLWNEIEKLPLISENKEDEDDDVIAPEDGQIERYNAYTRINPSGHREQVIKKKGKTDEETLNELDKLADSLMQLLESSPESSMPPGPCWYCDHMKDNILGICGNCGRFGKENQEPPPLVGETQPYNQVPWNGPDPTIGAERVFVPHSHGMSSERDYIRRQNNASAGFDEPINLPHRLTECTEEYIWKYVMDSLAEEIREWPGFKELVSNLIDEGLGPDEIVQRVDGVYWDDDI